MPDKLGLKEPSRVHCRTFLYLFAVNLYTYVLQLADTDTTRDVTIDRAGKLGNRPWPPYATGPQGWDLQEQPGSRVEIHSVTNRAVLFYMVAL